MLSRRSFFTGLGLMVAAPAIVRAESLMPIRAPKLILPSPQPPFALPRLFRITYIDISRDLRITAEAEADDGARRMFEVPSNIGGLDIGDLVVCT